MDRKEKIKLLKENGIKRLVIEVDIPIEIYNDFKFIVKHKYNNSIKRQIADYMKDVVNQNKEVSNNDNSNN